MSEETLSSLRLGKCFIFFVVCCFFQSQLFLKILSGIPTECQTVWIQIRPDILSGQIWVQTVCKSYQQTTLGVKECRDVVYSSKNIQTHINSQEFNPSVLCTKGNRSVCARALPVCDNVFSLLVFFLGSLNCKQYESRSDLIILIVFFLEKSFIT